MKRLGLILMFFFIVYPVKGGEYQYISTSELKEEMGERERDIKRTEARIASLLASEEQLRHELDSAKIDGKKTEALAVSRAQIYYRFIRQGKSIKYLFSADSAFDMHKRATFLSRLFKDGLNARREAGLRIAATEKKLDTLQTEKSAAFDMHNMLKEAYQELKSELQRRKAGHI